MPCFRPLKGYRSRLVNPATGKRNIVFKAQEAHWHDLEQNLITLPCGQCIGCRLDRSRTWAVRCVHEASLYERNCFITLTYRPEANPGTLVLRDHQLFMKKLRKRFGAGIRFFHCGEYGEKFSRPHYHTLLFNHDFDDRQLFKMHRGFPIYRSQALEELWEHGFSTVGDVTFESAAYVARYITKKITGNQALEHYAHFNDETGEIIQRQPEYTTMSRRPGIAKGFFEKYRGDIYPSDEVILRGKKLKPPKFYDRLFEVAYPQDFAILKRMRKRRSMKRLSLDKRESSYIRAMVAGHYAHPNPVGVSEFIQHCKFKQLKRGYENEA